MSIRPAKDGQPIPGSERVVPAADVAALLGLKDTPPPEPQQPDSPRAARLRREGKAAEADAVMDALRDTHMTRIVPGGREVADVWGIDGLDLPAGVEQALGPRKKPQRQDGWEPGRETRETTPPPADAAKLAADFRGHAAKVAAIAESAKGSGDTEREARAAAEVAASREVGERLKSAGIL